MEPQDSAEEHLKAVLGAVAMLCQELSVGFGIDAQHLRDAEDELSMRDGIENVVGNFFPELNTP